MARRVTLSKKSRAPKPEKPEKYVRLDADDPSWRLLEEVRKAHHSTLEDAKITLVYENNVKPDCDGHLVLGRAKKTPPLERRFVEHDFTILLNTTVWASLPEEGKRALLDHELCHCGKKTNAKGKVTYYTRKHDIEEFQEVVRRHGLYKSDLTAFVQAALGREQMPLFTDEERRVAIEAVKVLGKAQVRRALAETAAGTADA